MLLISVTWESIPAIQGFVEFSERLESRGHAGDLRDIPAVDIGTMRRGITVGHILNNQLFQLYSIGSYLSAGVTLAEAFTGS
jgi:hypothetical protein